MHRLLIVLGFTAVMAAGCGAMLPAGVKEIAKDPEGRTRYETSIPTPNESPIAKTFTSEKSRIKMGLPEGWTLEGENSIADSPIRVQFTRPSGWLTVFCWKDVQDIPTLQKNTTAAIAGIDAPLQIAKVVWVIPGAGVPAEMYTAFGFHDAQVDVPGKSEKVNVRFLKTFKIILKPAPTPGGCNYGIQLLELADGYKHTETMAGQALAIARSLQ